MAPYSLNGREVLVTLAIMNRVSVSSSHLASVGYEPELQILEVEFVDRSVYQYSSVPSYVYRGLMSASSHGSYLDSHVKKAGYPYRRVT